MFYLNQQSLLPNVLKFSSLFGKYKYFISLALCYRLWVFESQGIYIYMYTYIYIYVHTDAVCYVDWRNVLCTACCNTICVCSHSGV